ncbi:MAG: aminotransferase [Pseudomonadota bacterium]
MNVPALLNPFSAVKQIETAEPHVVDRADGVRVWDAQDKEYIDTASALWCVNVGYGRKQITRAMADQAERLPFFHSFNGTANEPALLFAEQILGVAPASMKRVFFGNSGSDANDSAIKLIWLYNNLRKQPQKRKMISRTRGYHGVTVASGSLTGLQGVHQFFNLPLDGFLHVSAPDLYRSPERDAQSYADELESVIQENDPDTVAAFFAEPVMGTGGVLPPPKGYFQAIKKVLDRYDILFVLDEVISGFGRLGAWFGAQHFDVKPDIIVSAKGLTSNYVPMSAVIIGEAISAALSQNRDDLGIFGHGFTTTAHPVAAAAGIANLDIIKREGLVERAGKSGTALLAQMQAACSDHPLVGDVRGEGLMVGVELVADKNRKSSFDPALGIGARMREVAKGEGILVRALINDICALSPPFIVSEDDVAQIVSRFRRALDRLAQILENEGVWRPLHS